MSGKFLHWSSFSVMVLVGGHLQGCFQFTGFPWNLLLSLIFLLGSRQPLMAPVPKLFVIVGDEFKEILNQSRLQQLLEIWNNLSFVSWLEIVQHILVLPVELTIRVFFPCSLNRNVWQTLSEGLSFKWNDFFPWLCELLYII